MNELLPGVFHWTTWHEGIEARVSSYYVEPAGALIDPRVPEEGIDVFADRDPGPQQVILSSAHHARHAQRFAERYGTTIRASREAQDRLDDIETEMYTDHDEIAPGIAAIHVDILSPDEYELYITAVEGGAIHFADGLHHYGGALGFFPDELLGDDPKTVKEGLKNAFRALLIRDFEHLFFAHGDPIVGHGKTALRKFVESPVGHEDFGQVL
jgi:hypothetical protein